MRHVMRTVIALGSDALWLLLVVFCMPVAILLIGMPIALLLLTVVEAAKRWL